MKLILIAIFLIISNNSWAINLTHKLQVTLIKYDYEKKNYDISFALKAGVYHADKALLKCLQKSIEDKINVNVEYEAIGLKIIKCTPL